MVTKIYEVWLVPVDSAATLVGYYCYQLHMDSSEVKRQMSRASGLKIAHVIPLMYSDDMVLLQVGDLVAQKNYRLLSLVKDGSITRAWGDALLVHTLPVTPL